MTTKRDDETPTQFALRVVTEDARRKALIEAAQAVDRAVRPLGAYDGATDSPWNKGYTHAKNQALNAIRALGDA